MWAGAGTVARRQGNIAYGGSNTRGHTRSSCLSSSTREYVSKAAFSSPFFCCAAAISPMGGAAATAAAAASWVLAAIRAAPSADFARAGVCRRRMRGFFAGVGDGGCRAGGALPSRSIPTVSDRKRRSRGDVWRCAIAVEVEEVGTSSTSSCCMAGVGRARRRIFLGTHSRRPRQSCVKEREGLAGWQRRTRSEDPRHRFS